MVILPLRRGYLHPTDNGELISHVCMRTIFLFVHLQVRMKGFTFTIKVVSIFLKDFGRSDSLKF